MVQFGKCTMTGKMFESGIIAHAHPDERGICFASKKLFTKNTLIHEIAHIIRGKVEAYWWCERGHDQQWAQTVKELGGTLTTEQQIRYGVDIGYTN